MIMSAFWEGFEKAAVSREYILRHIVGGLKTRAARGRLVSKMAPEDLVTGAGKKFEKRLRMMRREHPERGSAMKGSWRKDEGGNLLSKEQRAGQQDFIHDIALQSESSKRTARKLKREVQTSANLPKWQRR